MILIRQALRTRTPSFFNLRQKKNYERERERQRDNFDFKIYKIRNIFTIITIFKLYTGSIIILNLILKKIKINYCITTCCKEDLKNFIKKLFIYDVGYPLIRIGSKKDGGYLVPKILNKIKYCFSPGVGQSFAFEKNLKNYNIHSFLADNTVEDPSSLNDK